MPTIRDLVQAIAQREGVEATVVSGRDGLVIEALTSGDLDGEQLAALAPGIIAAADSVGASCGPRGGELVTAVLEFEKGLAVISSLSADALLLVVVHPSANIGSLLYDLRRHRGNIASIV